MSQKKRLKLDLPEPASDMIAILADDLLGDTPLVEVYVATILNPKHISRIIVEINAILPIPELTHLKRVRGKELLLHPSANITRQDLLKKLTNFKSELNLNNLRIIEVAKIAPKVRKQYECVHKLWPCNFHSNKYLEKLSNNNLFTKEEHRDLEQYMKIAIEIARYAKTRNLSRNNVGALMVDPVSNSVVAVGYDRSVEGPCRHATMVAIDNVAKSQNGGVWNDEGKLGEETVRVSSDEKSDGIISSDQIRTDDEKLVRFGTFNNELGLKTLNGINPPTLLKHLQDNFESVKFGATRFKEKDDLQNPSDGPYLCTGYYLFITHEPCCMCAMGLIHSRIKRVFYGVQTENGALGSLCKVHIIKDLNHHYEVFAGLLKNECEGLKDLL